MDTLAKRHVSENLMYWLEAAIAIIEFAEAAERRAHDQVTAQEINIKYDRAKSQIMAALERGIRL